MPHISLFRIFSSQSIGIRASFVIFALFVCLTVAQPTPAQLNLTITRNDDCDALRPASTPSLNLIYFRIPYFDNLFRFLLS
ncbi:MAG: hypothetical protein ACR2HG_02795 [Pyrinomonadaceae bacterium]